MLRALLSSQVLLFPGKIAQEPGEDSRTGSQGLKLYFPLPKSGVTQEDFVTGA